MRLLPLATLLALSLAFSCKEEPRPEDIAGRQAKAYYGHLLAGRCGLFAAGIHGFDSLPAAYREQPCQRAPACSPAAWRPRRRVRGEAGPGRG